MDPRLGETIDMIALPVWIIIWLVWVSLLFVLSLMIHKPDDRGALLVVLFICVCVTLLIYYAWFYPGVINATNN